MVNIDNTSTWPIMSQSLVKTSYINQRNMVNICILLLSEKFKMKNSIRDALNQQPGEIFFKTMTYRSSETVQRSGYFQSSASYIKVQTMSK